MRNSLCNKRAFILLIIDLITSSPSLAQDDYPTDLEVPFFLGGCDSVAAQSFPSANGHPTPAENCLTNSYITRAVLGVRQPLKGFVRI